MILMTFFNGYNKSNYVYVHNFMYIITVDLIIIHVAIRR